MQAFTKQDAPADDRDLTLVVDDPQELRSNATVRVRWFISHRLRQRLLDGGVNKPMLLLAVKNGKDEMLRRVVPLTDLMAFIPMNRPGTNVILAQVVSKSKSKCQEHSVTTIVMSRFDTGEYKLDLFPYGSDTVRPTFREFSSIDSHGETACVKVVVPQEAFAPPAPAWMNWLANYYSFWPKPVPGDQCDLRRRALLTPFVMAGDLIWHILKAISWVPVKFAIAAWIGILLFIGKRGVDFRPLLEPRSLAIAEVADLVERKSRWFWAKDESDFFLSYRRRSPIVCVLAPPVLLSVAILAQLLTWLSGNNALWIYIPLAVLVGALIATGMTLFSPQLRRDHEQLKRMKVEQQRSRLERQLAMMTVGPAEDGLVARPENISPAVSSLPAGTRTVYLRYLDLKRNVCKPFAK